MKFRHLINLQLFADENNPTLNTQTTALSGLGNDLSPTMKTFYEKNLLENARNEHYFAQFGQKVPLPKNSGHKVEWRKFDTFKKALTPLTEGVTPEGNKVNMTKIECALSQYGDYTTVSDLLELRAIDPIIGKVTEEHGAQAGDTIDTVIRNVVVAGTNVFYAPSIAAGGAETPVTIRNDVTNLCKITPKLIDQIFTFLKKMKAPTIDGKYVAIIHPSVAYDLRESDGWMEVHKYAQPEQIFNGEIGMLHNVRFIENTETKIWTNSHGAVYATMFFGKNAYGIVEPSAETMEVIVKPRGSAGTSDPLNQRSTIGWKATTAAKILYEERMVRLESGSFFSDVDKAN
ncbi:N4-gp56 family major capsid protein [Lachnoclostridium sp. Marseille-P6806]|uniref:N4-gp56 family major capsid protein n=1 Tax=Lachnoclostridium sp. Marseille-P6806 TaxID=2364793 RepID=UPI00103031BA|nr:N4-gp56 family major capsid protein [Lachnoclostridium sp. Marseille-P6806]